MSEVEYHEDHVVVTWSPGTGGVERVCLRDDATGQYPYKQVAAGGTHQIMLHDIPERAQWCVFRQEPGEDGWARASPLCRLWRADPARDATAARWEPAEQGGPYRILLHDDDLGKYVLDDVVTDTAYPLPWTVMDVRHRNRLRVMRLEDESWVEYLPLAGVSPPLEVIVGSRIDHPQPPLDLSDGEQLLVLFTVDTEGGLRQMRQPDATKVIDRYVFGDFADGPNGVGIGLHMDLLEQYGFRGSFFVDVLWEYEFGRETLERAIEEITSRGHEVQPHLHPTHLISSPRLHEREFMHGIYGHDADMFRACMEITVNLFTERAGFEPVAYRSGGYNMCEEFLAVLPEFGIRIDSSVNAFKNYRMPESWRTRTQPYFVGDVLEVPVTWMICEGNGYAPYQRQFAPHRYSERQDAFTDLPVAGRKAPLTSVYVSHSYQLLESTTEVGPEVNEAWNHELEARNPRELADIARSVNPVFSFVDGPVDLERVRRLDRTLRRFAERPEVRFVTFADLAAGDLEVWRERRDGPVDPVPVFRDGHGSAVVVTRVHNEPAPLDVEPDGPLTPVLDLLERGGATAGATAAIWGPEGLADTVRAAGLAPAVVAEGTAPPQIDRPVDLVVCVDMLHRLPPTAAFDALVALHDGLLPGGTLVFRAPTCFSASHGTIDELYWGRPLLDPPPSSNAQTAGTLLTSLRRAGFAGRHIASLRRDRDLPAAWMDKLGFFSLEERTTYAVEFIGERRLALDRAHFAFAEGLGR